MGAFCWLVGRLEQDLCVTGDDHNLCCVNKFSQRIVWSLETGWLLEPTPWQGMENILIFRHNQICELFVEFRFVSSHGMNGRVWMIILLASPFILTTRMIGRHDENTNNCVFLWVSDL